MEIPPVSRVALTRQQRITYLQAPMFEARLALDFGLAAQGVCFQSGIRPRSTEQPGTLRESVPRGHFFQQRFS